MVVMQRQTQVGAEETELHDKTLSHIPRAGDAAQGRAAASEIQVPGFQSQHKPSVQASKKAEAGSLVKVML